jgi:hypothetical protein
VARVDKWNTDFTEAGEPVVENVVDWLREHQFGLRDAEFGYRNPIYGDKVVQPAVFIRGYSYDTQEWYIEPGRMRVYNPGAENERTEERQEFKNNPDNVHMSVIISMLGTKQKDLYAPQVGIKVTRRHEKGELAQRYNEQLWYKTLTQWRDDHTWKAIIEHLDYGWKVLHERVEQDRVGGLDNFNF